MKGIILAGGTGSRLFPVTAAVNKQLVPVYDKPMIYYALTTLLSASINEICIICSADDISGYKKLLGDGREFGSSLTYIIQEKPEGIPQACVLAAEFIGADPVALILGDNIFVDNGDIRRTVQAFRNGAHIFGIQVKHPEQYGVLEFDENMSLISLIEKPKKFISRFAIPGFYLFDCRCILLAQSLKKSRRGELEIIDLLKLYLADHKLSVSLLSRGTGWIDAGTTRNHAIASRYIESMQQMHGIMVGSPHEAAFVRGFIKPEDLRDYAMSIKPSDYGDYLDELVTLDAEFGLCQSI